MQLICKEWIWFPQDSGLDPLRNRPKMTKVPSGHIRYFEARIDRAGTINRTGYGAKIRTGHMVRINNRWRRVYVACFGNASTLYVGKPGAWEWTIEGERV